APAPALSVAPDEREFRPAISVSQCRRLVRQRSSPWAGARAIAGHSRERGRSARRVYGGRRATVGPTRSRAVHTTRPTYPRLVAGLRARPHAAKARSRPSTRHL